jgi:hypothetical protein
MAYGENIYRGWADDRRFARKMKEAREAERAQDAAPHFSCPTPIEMLGNTVQLCREAVDRLTEWRDCMLRYATTEASRTAIESKYATDAAPRLATLAAAEKALEEALEETSSTGSN